MSVSLSILRAPLLALGLVVAGWPVADGPLAAQFWRPARERITEAQVRGHMEMLASDALQGRASGTRDELIAATYIASQLRQWGLEPLGDAGGFVQTVATARGQTWNVLARLSGSDRRGTEAILLSAHLDHVGVRGADGDTIFNGADDDASGVTAVLELARTFAAGRRPRRTILFAWFGSEEAGGAGSRYFADQPPVPLASIVPMPPWRRTRSGSPASSGARSAPHWRVEEPGSWPILIRPRTSSSGPTTSSSPFAAWWPTPCRVSDFTATTMRPATKSPGSISRT
jgi:hypothetical protein